MNVTNVLVMLLTSPAARSLIAIMKKLGLLPVCWRWRAGGAEPASLRACFTIRGRGEIAMLKEGQRGLRGAKT